MNYEVILMVSKQYGEIKIIISYCILHDNLIDVYAM